MKLVLHVCSWAEKTLSDTPARLTVFPPGRTISASEPVLPGSSSSMRPQYQETKRKQHSVTASDLVTCTSPICLPKLALRLISRKKTHSGRPLGRRLSHENAWAMIIVAGPLGVTDQASTNRAEEEWLKIGNLCEHALRFGAVKWVVLKDAMKTKKW
jgi:hypothetical protein